MPLWYHWQDRCSQSSTVYATVVSLSGLLFSKVQLFMSLWYITDRTVVLKVQLFMSLWYITDRTVLKSSTVYVTVVYHWQDCSQKFNCLCHCGISLTGLFSKFNRLCHCGIGDHCSTVYATVHCQLESGLLFSKFNRLCYCGITVTVRSVDLKVQPFMACTVVSLSGLLFSKFNCLCHCGIGDHCLTVLMPLWYHCQDCCSQSSTVYATVASLSARIRTVLKIQPFMPLVSVITVQPFSFYATVVSLSGLLFTGFNCLWLCTTVRVSITITSITTHVALNLTLRVLNVSMIWMRLCLLFLFSSVPKGLTFGLLYVKSVYVLCLFNNVHVLYCVQHVLDLNLWTALGWPCTVDRPSINNFFLSFCVPP